MNDTYIVAVNLLLPSKLGYEKRVRRFINGLFPQLGFASERIADAQTAVSEACINAIEHGNQGRPGLHVQVTLGVARNYVDVIVADEGVCRHPGVETAPASIEQKLAGLAPARGMGLMLIRQLVDEAGFLPAQLGHGNRFRLRVYRATKCQVLARNVENRRGKILRRQTDRHAGASVVRSGAEYCTPSVMACP